MGMPLVLALFALAAIAGLIMAVKVFAGGTPPWALSLLHAAFGAAGIVTLYLAIASTPVGGPQWISLGLFAAAALGGFFLASFHLRGQQHPKGVLVLHAGLAIAAFVLLGGTFLQLF